MKFFYTFLAFLLTFFLINTTFAQETPCTATVFTLADTPPANCGNQTFSGSLSVGTTDSGVGDPGDCLNNAYTTPVPAPHDTWFTFDLPSGVSSFSLNIEMTGCTGGSCNVAYAIYSEGTDCDNLNYHANSCSSVGSILSGNNSNQISNFTGFPTGSTIYVRIWEKQNEGGILNLSVESAPPNDECINATPLTGKGCNYGATDTETDAGDLGGNPSNPTTSPWTPDPFPFNEGVDMTICEATDPNAFWNVNDNAVWYTFSIDANEPQPITIEIFDIACVNLDDPSAAQMQMGVWSNTGTCDLELETFYACAIGIGDLSITDITLPVGDYYLLVDGFFGADCEWTVNTSFFCNISAGEDKGYCAGDNINVALGGTPSTNDPAPVITWTAEPTSAISFINDVNAANPIFTMNNAMVGTYEYYVEMVGSSPDCLARDTIVIEVFPEFDGDVSQVNSGECTNDPIVLTASASGGSGDYTYEWSDGLGNSSSVQPNVTINGTTYTVTISDANANCSVIKNITVDPTTSAPDATGLDISTNVNTLCGTGSVTITLNNSQIGLDYRVTPSGVFVAGTGEAITLLTTTISTTTTYNVTVRDANVTDCRSTANGAVTVTVNPIPDINIMTEGGGGCQGQPTLITTTVSPDGDYSYSWSPTTGLSDATIPNPEANPSQVTNYTLTVTDNNTGCSNTEMVTVSPSGIIPNLQLEHISANPNPICVGESTVIRINPSQVGVEYRLTSETGVQFGITVEGTGGEIELPTTLINETTTYGVIAFSVVNGDCFIRVLPAVTIEVQEPFGSADAGSDITTCTTTATLQANLTDGIVGTWTQISGPDATITNPNDPNTTVTDLISGETYVFEWGVINEACTGEPAVDSDQVTVTIQDLTVDATPTSTSTVGGNDGTLTLCITGGTAPYTITYTPNEGAINVTNGPCDGNYLISGLTEGCYDIQIEDSQGCSQTLPNQCIPGPSCSSFNVVDVQVQNETCNESNNGSLTITTTNGVGEITYDIGNGIPSVTTTDQIYTFENLPAGIYSVIVTDERDCSIAYLLNPVTITEPDALNVTYTTISPTSVGGTNGSVNICITGGTAPYTVVSTPSAVLSTTQTGCNANYTIPDIGEGVYNILVTDSNGCEFSIQAVVNPIGCNINAQASFSEPSCNGESDGTVTVTVTGGGTSFQYSIDGSPLTAPTTDRIFVFSDVTAGTHTIMVVDNENCDTETTVIVTQPDELGATYTSTAPSSVGGNDGSIEICVTGGTGPYTTTPTGTSAGANASCNDVITIDNLAPGAYSVLITDTNGCQYTIVNATVPETSCSGLTLNIDEKVDVSCHQTSTGEITVTVNGGVAPFYFSLDGISFVPTGGSSLNTYTFTSLPAGTYTVYVRDGSLCQISSQTITITQPTSLPSATVDIVPPSALGANDGQICISPMGGTPPYTINASCGTVVMGAGSQCGGTYHIDGLSAGSCFIEVIDALGCVSQASVTLSDPLCNDFILENVTASNYTCTDTNDGSITITVSGGLPPYTYTLGNTSETTNETTYTFSPLTEGFYSNISVEDSRGCIVSTGNGFNINNVDPITVSGIGTSPDCDGTGTGGITFTVSGGTQPYTYLWSDSSTDYPRTNLPNGDYSVTITDANGCTGMFDNIQVPLSDLAVNTDNISPACDGQSVGSISITASGGTAPYSYDWQTPLTDDVTTQNGLDAGQYSVTVTDLQGCSVTGLFTIPTSNFTVDFTTTADCNNEATGEIDITVTPETGDYSYTWSNDLNSTQDQNSLTEGNYSVTVTDNDSGCTEIRNITISPSSITVQLTPTGTCSGESNGMVTANVTGGSGEYTYEWSTGGSNTDTASGLNDGNITITITDNNTGCVVTGSTNVPEFDNPTVTASVDPNGTVFSGQTIELTSTVTGGTPDYSFMWSPTTTEAGIDNPTAQNTSATPDVTTEQTIAYTVKVTDANGCMDEAIVNVPVSVAQIFVIPTGFSPNNSGDNNDFHPVTNYDPDITVFKIFNRWGQLIFDDPNGHWDGTFQGAAQPIGTYAYLIEYIDGTGQKQVCKGHISLIR